MDDLVVKPGVEVKPRPLPKPAKPGAMAGVIMVGERELQGQIRLAATHLAFGPKVDPKPNRLAVWTLGGDELAVRPGAMKVAVGEGRITIEVNVQCTELGKVSVPVEFAVGSERKSARLLATTLARPKSLPDELLTWRKTIVACGWEALLDALVMLAAAEGVDDDGDPLAPVSVIAAHEMVKLRVGARSRTSKDRTIDRIGSARQRAGRLGQVRG